MGGRHKSRGWRDRRSKPKTVSVELDGGTLEVTGYSRRDVQRIARAAAAAEARPKWPLTGDPYTDHATMQDAELAIESHEYDLLDDRDRAAVAEQEDEWEGYR